MRTKLVLLAVIAIVGLLSHANTPVLAAQPADDLSAFAGTWTINLDRSRMGRAGPNATQTRRASTFTWIFAPTADGLRMEIYTEYPASTPSKTLLVRPDGQQHVCEMNESCLSTPGDPKEQSYAFWRINPKMLVRAFQIRGQYTEYNVYAVSEDGKTFVATSWNPSTPEYQNVQVFERRP